MSDLPPPAEVAFFDQLMAEVERTVGVAREWLAEGNHPSDVATEFAHRFSQAANGQADPAFGPCVLLAFAVVQLAELTPQEKP